MFALVLVAGLGQADGGELTAKQQAAVKAAFKGKFKYDRKTGAVAVAYDFKNKGQLKDFSKATAAMLSGQSLLLDTGVSVEHVARWKSLTVSATLTTQRMRGPIFATTSGVKMHAGGFNPDTLYLNVPGSPEGATVAPGDSRTGRLPVQFVATPAKCVAAYGGTRVAGPGVTEPVGRLTLSGGERGYAFAAVMLSGELDPAWVAELTKAVPRR